MKPYCHGTSISKFRSPPDCHNFTHSSRETTSGYSLRIDLRTLFLLDMSSNKAEGRREDALAKQRSQMREDFERQKQTLIQETEKARPSSNRFVGQHDSMEETLKNSTVGLVHLQDFQQKRRELEEAKAREAARSSDLK